MDIFMMLSQFAHNNDIDLSNADVALRKVDYAGEPLERPDITVRVQYDQQTHDNMLAIKRAFPKFKEVGSPPYVVIRSSTEAYPGVDITFKIEGAYECETKCVAKGPRLTEFLADSRFGETTDEPADDVPF
jgi:hypothetical protein